MTPTGSPDMWSMVPPQLLERLRTDERFKNLHFDRRPTEITEQAWLEVQPYVDQLLEGLHTRNNALLYEAGLNIIGVIRLYFPLFEEEKAKS